MPGFWIVYRKELLDLVRDRRTLLFVLLLPTVSIPLLIFAMTQFVKKVAEERALESVVIAASPETQRAYRDAVHTWFLSTELSAGFRVASSPLFRILMNPEQAKQLPDIPSEIFTSPEAFEGWTKSLVDKARASLSEEDKELQAQLKEVPSAMQDQLRDFQNIAIKGMGLVRFVDPASLPAADSTFDPQALPAELRTVENIGSIATALRSRKVHGVLDIPATVEELRKSANKRAEVVFYYDSTTALSAEARERIGAAISGASKAVVEQRLKAQNLSKDFMRPLELKSGTNVASRSRRAMAVFGALIPYLIFAFAFLGGMQPASDLGAGEKERNTLETLLLSPCSRLDIALGKFLTILTTSCLASLLGLASMYVGVTSIIPAHLLAQLELKLPLTLFFMIALLILPAAAFFASLMLALSIFARSQKESQSYMSPLSFIIVVPGLVMAVPDLETTWQMSLVPLLNVTLLTRDFVKGDGNWTFFALTMLSSLALAAASLWYAMRQFQREEVLFRS